MYKAFKPQHLHNILKENLADLVAFALSCDSPHSVVLHNINSQCKIG